MGVMLPPSLAGEESAVPRLLLGARHQASEVQALRGQTDHETQDECQQHQGHQTRQTLISALRGQREPQTLLHLAQRRPGSP